MPHALAHAVEIVATVLAVASIGYFLTAIVAARVFLFSRRRSIRALQQQPTAFSPGVTILKSLKGLDPGMIDAFRSHCHQNYAGDYELLFGVSTLSDPAAAAVLQLQQEFPDRSIQLFECPLQLGTNGKVSTLIQLAAHARYDILLINDSDITVTPHYLERVMSCFAPEQAAALHRSVGLVTALYRGRAHGTMLSRLESLGIATDFMAGVLLSKLVEGGLHYGLGSTLAMRRDALEKMGGLAVLVDQLADDYELGVRVDKAGYRIALSTEVVETSVPPYEWRGFVEHQLRWARTVRDARPGGYAGLLFTYGLPLALLNVVASGLSPISLWIFAMSLFLRLSLAMTVGAEVLGDHQVLGSLWLLPLRDVIAMGLWVAGFASNTIVWRGNRFTLKNGKLEAATD